MSVTDDDLELLEGYLDNELSEAQAASVRSRLASETELAEVLEQLRGQRVMRHRYWESLMGNQADVDAAVLGIHSAIGRREASRRHFRWAGAAGALAACLVVGLMIGRFMDMPSAGTPGSETNVTAVNPRILPLQNPAVPPPVAPRTYEVEVTDLAGNVIAVQKFNTLEEAREFSEDLNRLQRPAPSRTPFRDDRILPASAEQF